MDKYSGSKGSNRKNDVDFKLMDTKVKSNNKNSGFNEEFIATNPEDTIRNFKKVERIIYEEKNNVRKSKKKKKKKKSKKLKFLSVILVVILILIIVLSICMLTLPVFDLKNITMTGTDKYDAGKVADIINLKTGENVFVSMFKSDKERTKNEFPYIDKITYKYRFPSSVEIKVNERVDYYYVSNKEDFKYYMLDKQGYILSQLDSSSSWNEKTILVSGITFENNVVIGEKINEIDIGKLDKFDTFKESLLSNIEGSKITRVTFENEYMKIYVNSSVEVIFEINKKLKDYNISLLKLIMKDIEGQKGTIDMTKDNPTFVRQ